MQLRTLTSVIDDNETSRELINQYNKATGETTNAKLSNLLNKNER